ncbi:haloacid dehalogenase superfamily, subfamily IA, variant 3 with third motif having DD or ED/haloacid dehalogenase superfamily, subfamily IA, variant 1 with third motif having Dx(3-4)D or Dx(3-4)E [Anaerosporobacter mobilis DSM 15930]|jgi:HAD superfamily hydrolase (TIGR01509 family)|uniref:Haloacid dehalogenase superfamily, subfamily IA, variant 3 with third motif having DD or ED/haloacid dehalogenase superfamily, subfamily IA, variant 1 with third motif having Dx(3-4)D or Dx(3-4)E n=1 Tax=Anaerosporobacter mobilis DSM 15930 TaxID=1120996 RepID=A0A1M7GYC8_9FIRM|nr:HAD family phosphatase [Anaerosporobacter mobilis]SHM21158.1 haloacid dehalogenase superfamily, subfamily IA, variant 3 with third motif having DD or ED/haloacid dehalogenase superfamily, subfamily IA, variant 1 with third motif having Dx(3-4)D or Dx(3-4)E [Anaerosporobacter mobilis DSM 15930]
MLNNIKAVIFDLDGTLVDSMWMWREIDVEYLSQFDIEVPSDLQQAVEGMSFSETAQYFKERFNLPDPVEVIKMEWNKMAWDKYGNEVPLKKGVIEFLEELRSRGIKTGIATSNSKELVEHVLKSLNITEYFDSVRTSCEAKKGKPAPDIYLLVADDLQVDPKDCLVFEDLALGIMAGKGAGMRVCTVFDPYSEDDRDRKRKLADYYIDTYFDIFEDKVEKLA